LGYIKEDLTDNNKEKKIYIEIEKKKYLASIIPKPLNIKNFRSD